MMVTKLQQLLSGFYSDYTHKESNDSKLKQPEETLMVNNTVYLHHRYMKLLFNTKFQEILHQFTNLRKSQHLIDNSKRQSKYRTQSEEIMQNRAVIITLINGKISVKIDLPTYDG